MVKTEDWTNAQGAVIGSALIDPACVPFLLHECSPDDFTGEYRTLLDAIRDLAVRGQVVDPVTVLNAVGKEYRETVKQALEIKKNQPLSQAAMEVLAIVAYNQQVTKSFVEQVRGVDSSSTVNTLVERGLLEERGRLELPGRPVAYGTTAHFLRSFGLSGIGDLPMVPGTNSEDPEVEGQVTLEEAEAGVDLP